MTHQIYSLSYFDWKWSQQWYLVVSFFKSYVNEGFSLLKQMVLFVEYNNFVFAKFAENVQDNKLR